MIYDNIFLCVSVIVTNADHIMYAKKLQNELSKAKKGNCVHMI